MGKTTLCLHFDINKTIIMSDLGSGRSIEGTLNSLLSECAWGNYNEKPISERLPSDWSLQHPHPSTDPPKPGLVTLGSFLEDHTKLPKSEQRKAKTTFTELGGLGELFRPFYEEIKNSLTPSTVTESFKFIETGYYHIIPSFFRLIEYLVDENYEFYLIFRTFGVDAINVIEEFNIFCEGMHPIFKPKKKLDGSDPSFCRDLRIKYPFCSGKITRFSDDANGIQFLRSNSKKEEDTITGSKDIYDLIMRKWFQIPIYSLKTQNFELEETKKPEKHYSAMIQDDYEYWHKNEESDTSGKLMMINPSANDLNNDYSLIEVFFDDNIERDRAHIVDVRDYESFNPISFSEAVKNNYIRRVEPYKAIVNENYYIDEIKSIIEKNRK